MGGWARVGIALLLFVAAVLLQAQDLEIVEREIRVTSSESNLKFRLPITSNSTAAINGRVELQILDFNDLVVTKASQEVSLPTGNGNLEVVVPAPQEQKNKTDFPWYRLKYSITGGSKPLTGIVALGACMPDLFTLTIIHPREALEGNKLEVRIRSVNPVTKHPVAGVAVSAQLNLDTDKPLTAKAVTGRSGDIVLSFALPRPLDTDEGEIKFEATKGVQRDSQDVSFDVPHRLKFVLSTDKLLYQPGQALHARALILDENKRALVNTDAEFTLTAPDESVLFRETAKTNDYGIANVDWELAAFVRLGD
jgi:hypothetical protein